MNKGINTLLVKFGNEIARHELPLFRGAIVDAVVDADVLFHNLLDDDKLRYSYPLIQYKRLNGKAAIVCVGEGTEAIGQLFSSCNFDVCLGERRLNLDVERIQPQKTLVQVWQDMFAYHLRSWLPLNQGNYERYMNTESVAERYAMLERLLVGNILSFAKGVGVHFEEQVVCKITVVDEPRTIRFKNVKMMAFDVEFKSNVSLPNYIGIGKGVSLGHGVVVRNFEKKD
ncbi:MAG: hypothetical protein J6W49_05910 [Paludibacteraceae bacterium]|nr:hypothetical protein [Paludibacteraceae bacterium]